MAKLRSMWTRRGFLGATVLAPLALTLPLRPGRVRAQPAASVAQDAEAQLRAAITESRRRLELLEQDHPDLRAHLVLATQADQAALPTSLRSLVERLPGAFELSPDVDAIRALLREEEEGLRRLRWTDRWPAEEEVERRRQAIARHARAVRLSDALLIELRFDELRYPVVAEIKRSRLIDRTRTKAGADSIRVVMGSVLELAAACRGVPAGDAAGEDDILF